MSVENYGDKMFFLEVKICMFLSHDIRQYYRVGYSYMLVPH